MAINDSLLLEHSIYKILEMYFKDHEKYVNFLHEFLQVFYLFILSARAHFQENHDSECPQKHVQ